MSDNDAAQANNKSTTPGDKPITETNKTASSSSTSSTTGAAAEKPKPKGNPAFRALGLPNWRLRLPSRNWSIFLSVVGSFSCALYYDRRQKKAVQKKWCTLVEHVASESLPTNSLARRVTIVLAAPPGDGLRVAREHFTEYIKPVLVAGALDWDVIEGRKEGEVRAGLATRIRKLRRANGEVGTEPLERDVPMALAEVRERSGIYDYPGPKGDIVIGRHAWKEYVRGLHEGWLGPIDAPKPPPAESPPESESSEPPLESYSAAATPQESTEGDAATSKPSATTEDTSSSSDNTPNKEKKPSEKPARPPVPPAHNNPLSYSDSPLPSSCPDEFQGSVPIPLPHLLGVLNTPIRIYRFLTRRHLADEVGRQAAAAVLAAHRSYETSSMDSTTSYSTPAINQDEADTSDYTSQNNTLWEQQTELEREEADWNKKSRKRKDGEGERVWLDPMVIDPRLGERMRKFQLEPGEEERARWIGKGVAGIPGRTVGDDGGLEKSSE